MNNKSAAVNKNDFPEMRRSGVRLGSPGPAGGPGFPGSAAESQRSGCV